MSARRLASFLALVASLASPVGLSACDKGAPPLRVELPGTLKLAQLADEDRARLTATFEVPGLLAESPLTVSDDGKEATGSFTVDVDAPTTRPFTLRLKYTAESGDEVLLARLEGEVEIAPREENLVAPSAAGFDVCGAPEEGAPCALLFDRNRNGAPNLDDLVAGISPLPPPPFVDAAPDFLQFPSGIRLGDFARQVIVVENSSARPIEARATLVGAPGVTLSRYETTQAPESAAQRALELGTIAPFEQAFLAVSFAPVNAYLTVGDVYIEAYDAETRVAQATKVRIIANADGDLAPPAVGYAPAPIADGADLGGYPGPVELYDGRLLFSGLTNNLAQSLAYTGATLTAAFPGEDGGRREAIPADAAYLVEIPAGHKLSVSLGGLRSDVDLAVLLLEDDDSISDDPARNLRPGRAGPSPEAVEVRNDDSTAQRALVVLGRMETEPPPAIPNGLAVSEPVPIELGLHATRAPEFTAPPAPVRGPLEGGNRVVLTGRGFHPNAQVTFAGALALDCSHTPGDEAGTSRLTCTAPAGSLVVGKNPATLVVENPSVDEGGDGQAASLVQGYVYEPPAPRLDEVRPPVAPDTGSDGPISLRGAFFSRRNGLPEVRFGDIVATEVTFVDSGHLEVVAPPHAPGIVPVTVRNVLDPLPGDDEGFVRLSPPSNLRNFTYIVPEGPAPTLASVTPETGTIDGGFALTLSGTGFVSGMLVNVGGAAATSVQVVDASVATAIAPAREAGGPVDVEVVNPDGQRARLEGALDYFVPAPEVASVFPSEAALSGGTFVVVAGQGFRSGIRVSFRDGGGTVHPAANVNRVSSSTLLVATPPVPTSGSYTLRVENLDGQAAERGGFSFLPPQGPPPRIEQVTPSSAELGAPPNVVVLRGGDFRNPTVLMGASVAIQSPLEDGESEADTIRFIPVEPTLPGPSSIRVVNDDGQSDTAVFTWLPASQPTPRLEQVIPAEASYSASEPTWISVSGRDLPVVPDDAGGPGALKLDPNARLRFGPDLVPHDDVDVTSPTAFTFPLPDFDARVGGEPVTTIAITLTSPDGQVAGIDFRYLLEVLPEPPEVQAVSPEAAAVGQSVTVRGVRFGAAPLVQLGGVAVTTTSASDVALAFVVPDIADLPLPASVSLRVTDPVTGLSDTTSLTLLPTAPIAPPPSVSLVLPEVLHARVPGEKLRLIGNHLAGVESAVLEAADGAGLGDALILAQGDTFLEVELPVGLLDGPDNSDARYQLRLVQSGHPDVVSPRFEARRPRAYFLSKDEEGAVVLGEHLHPGALRRAQLSGDGEVYPLVIGARSETFLRLTAPNLNLVPGLAFDIQLIYADPSGAELPPLTITGPELPPLTEPPLHLGIHDPVPADTDLGGRSLPAYLGDETDDATGYVPGHGVPAGFEVLDAGGAVVATGSWSPDGCCYVSLAFASGATLPAGAYAVRLATDRTSALAVSEHTLFAVPRGIDGIHPPVTGNGMDVEVHGSLLPNDVVVAKHTTTDEVVTLWPEYPPCEVQDCPLRINTEPLSEGVWRLCAAGMDEEGASCPGGPTLEIVGSACDAPVTLAQPGELTLPLDRFFHSPPCSGPGLGRLVSLSFTENVHLQVRGGTEPATSLGIHVYEGFCANGWSANGTCGDTSTTFSLFPGDYEILVVAQDALEIVDAHLSISARNAADGECLTNDLDDDGYTPCDGDCLEGEDAAYPGAAEVCDGLDNDCDGSIDNLDTACTIPGQLGACAVGQLVCQALEPVCEQRVFPEQEAEVCGDSIDNDCDGDIDESSCD